MTEVDHRKDCPNTTDVASNPTAVVAKDPAAVMRIAEYFGVHVKHLPKYWDVGHSKKFINGRLGSDVKLAKSTFFKEHAYLKFESEQDAEAACEKLDGLQVRKRSLKATRTNSLDSAGTESSESVEKAAKLDADPALKNGGCLTEDDAKSFMNNWEAKVQDATTPLHSLPYSEQLKQKQESCQTLLESVSSEIDSIWGGIFLLGGRRHLGTLQEIQGCPKIEGSRNKCEFNVGRDPFGKPTVGVRVGQPKTGRAFVLPPTPCRHIPEAMKQIVSKFQEYLSNSSLPPYDTTNNTGFWRQILVRSTLFDNLVAVAVCPTGYTERDIDQVKADLKTLFMPNDVLPAELGFRVTSLHLQQQVNTSDLPVYELISGAPYIYETLFNRLRFRISPGSFFQTNTSATEMLYRSIGDACSLSKDTLLLDVCSGTGSIGISLADRVGYVLGVEICPEATRDAQQSALANGLAGKCEFVCGRAEEYFVEFQKKYANVDDTSLPGNCKRIVAVVDPPRGGLPGKIIAALRQMSLCKTVCYVSCDPKVARKNFVDLCRPPSNRYGGSPFMLKNVIPDDMFPLTVHYEWVMLFERK